MSTSPNHNLKLTNLNVAQHNIRGLETNKTQVINYLDKFNVHVYMASEILLKPGDSYFLKNYTFLDQRRKDGYAGAAIFFKNNISFKAIDLPDFHTINVGKTYWLCLR